MRILQWDEENEGCWPVHKQPCPCMPWAGTDPCPAGLCGAAKLWDRTFGCQLCGVFLAQMWPFPSCTWQMKTEVVPIQESVRGGGVG